MSERVEQWNENYWYSIKKLTIDDLFLTKSIYEGKRTASPGTNTSPTRRSPRTGQRLLRGGAGLGSVVT